KYDSEIQNDMSDGNSYGVSGTPTFFINGISLVGAQPYSAFEAAIEQELGK
ncbi:MAG: DsbA family protein, partial [Nanoarchaeota archaeon]